MSPREFLIGLGSFVALMVAMCALLIVGTAMQAPL
jgi:hypothetical protein